MERIISKKSKVQRTKRISSSISWNLVKFLTTLSSHMTQQLYVMLSNESLLWASSKISVEFLTCDRKSFSDSTRSNSSKVASVGSLREASASRCSFVDAWVLNSIALNLSASAKPSVSLLFRLYSAALSRSCLIFSGVRSAYHFQFQKCTFSIKLILICSCMSSPICHHDIFLPFQYHSLFFQEYGYPIKFFKI